ncbi:unnamed protein product [Closterium sp. NIES-65]|nr:unnamed protein product [Closterium sp. NIES-65]
MRSPLLQLLTTFVLRRLELRLPVVGGAAAAGAGRAGAVGVANVEAVVGAVEALVGAAVEEEVVVGAAGQVAAVVAAVGVVEVVVVAAVVAAVGVEAAAVGVEAAAVGVAGVAPARGEALEVASSSSNVSPFRPRSSVSGQTYEWSHTQHRCFNRLTDAFRAEFPYAPKLPDWAALLRQNVDIFALDFDAILSAMYALTIGDEGDCYLCLPPDPGIEAAALGASESAALGAGESALFGTASAAALHTFTLDSGASCCLFRNSTTVTPLTAPVAVSLADPSGGPVLARSSNLPSRMRGLTSSPLDGSVWRSVRALGPVATWPQ